jgi:hypothetical protein
MKRLVKLALLSGLLFPCTIMAQNASIRLTCPLNEAIVVPPAKNAIQYDPPDFCIVLTSLPDTIVKACTGSIVTNVVKNEEGDKWEVVIFCKYKDKEYYFWYTGLEKVIVKRNERLKEGQTIGFIKPSGTIELLMYDFETPIDPTKYLECKNVLEPAKGF